MTASSRTSVFLTSLAASAFLAGAALAGPGGTIGMTSSGNPKSPPSGTAQPTTNCPTGQVWDAAAKKCVATSAVNYNSSKSNTGNFTSAKYHCGHGEWMNNNGDCIKNPPNNPN